MEENNVNTVRDMDDELTNILKKLESIESLIFRRLLEDKSKNELIYEVKKHLQLRSELDTHMAMTNIFKEILVVLDRLEQGIPSEEFNQSVAEELLTMLNRFGVEEIENSGKINYRLHEVVGIQSDDEKEVEEIIEVLEKGYVLGDKVIRPSKVIVNSHN